jgi:hypothetical protein
MLYSFRFQRLRDDRQGEQGDSRKALRGTVSNMGTVTPQVVVSVLDSGRASRD